ncbi:hypothetical protein [Altererythrobacter sp.]|uniref:hypothetical protein n=1 Tax=Altererythrobacter sp. TaxID=1872480 RepID=UPI003CFF8B57
MDTSSTLTQFLGSLLAILALAGIAYWLKLGPAPRLENEADARRAADEAVSGFDPVAIGIDAEGRGAIMRDARGRLLVLRPHGTHFAGRILSAGAQAQGDGERLLIDTGEKRFGPVHLTLEGAETWAAEIRSIYRSSDA